MTNQEKKIRSDWGDFITKNNSKVNKIVLSKDQIDSVLSNLLS